MPKRPLIRFVVGGDAEHHRQLSGVVAEVDGLHDDDVLSDEEWRRAQDAFAWLNEHLPVPPYARNNWRDDCSAWFKDGAVDAIARLWDLVAILREHDVPFRLLRSTNPGRVVYEDDFQVVVEEWNRI